MHKAGILVIADDLTGAAEIAGIALRYGLSSQIVQHLQERAQVDVQVLNSNSRSLKIDEAFAHLGRLFSASQTKQWDWVFLKFDSALRGHIKEELMFYGSLFQAEQRFFCPVNPYLQRVICDGQYLVEGKPIAETSFADDPEFPVRSSDILDVVGRGDWHVLRQAAQLRPEIKQVVAGAEGWEDLHAWSAAIPRKALCAGAAAFFECLLRNRLNCRESGGPAGFTRRKPILYVCGSNHEQSVTRISTLAPKNVIYWRKVGGEWEVAEQLAELLKQRDAVVFAVQPGVSEEAKAIRASMALVVSMLKGMQMPSELIIEGGATARAVLESLNIDILLPVLEHAPGVIRNEVPGGELIVTLKPGSYPWTKELWAFGPQT